MPGRKAIPVGLKDDDQQADIGKSRIEAQKAATPSIKTSRLVCPKDLSEGAKKEWRRVVKLYRECEIDVFNDLDQETLKSYCAAVDIRTQLYRRWLIDEKGALLVDDTTKKNSVRASPSGTPIETSASQTDRKVVNPILRELDRYANTIRILAEQLALTPVGRAAYAVRTEKANRSPVEEFMED